MQLPDLVVVSPDSGFVKQARKFASPLGTSIAIVDKERTAHDERARVLEIVAEVRGKPRSSSTTSRFPPAPSPGQRTRLVERAPMRCMPPSRTASLPKARCSASTAARSGSCW
jgi:hypothetical protein